MIVNFLNGIEITIKKFMDIMLSIADNKTPMNSIIKDLKIESDYFK
jgi:hypothetical protein